MSAAHNEIVLAHKLQVALRWSPRLASELAGDLGHGGFDRNDPVRAATFSQLIRFRGAMIFRSIRSSVSSVMVG